MKETVKWWVVFGLHSWLLYAAFGLGSDGALSVIEFAVWALAILVSFALSEASIKKTAERPRTPYVSDEASWAQAWLTLGVLVWFGHIFTGIAWGYFMAATYWRNAEVAKLRAATP